MEGRNVVSVIIVDSNIFIFGETEAVPEREMAIRRYGEVTGKERIGTNVIILSETFHIIKRINGYESAAMRIGSIVNNPFIDFLDFAPELVLRAAKLARDFQMRINDALIAQQAIETGASILTDNVKDFKKIKSIKVIPLRG